MVHKIEKTLVIIKPDAINRGLVGEVIHRFERKGLKIIGIKMKHFGDKELEMHYAHHKSKPFFKRLVKFMKSAPSLLVVLEGRNVVDVVRMMAGPTYGVEAQPGTIRGDYSLSMQNTIIHASDSAKAAEQEIGRFFRKDELFPYNKIDFEMVYSEDERK